jgi:Protein of unknown function (DUF4245)
VQSAPTPDQAAPAPTRQPSAAPTRRSGSGRDMTISLIVLFIPLLLVVGLFRLRGGEDPVVVDPSAEIGQAQSAGLFAVAVPKGLGEGWRPVRADFAYADGVATLRVGYLTPDDGTVQLLETNEDPQTLLPREFGDDVRPDGQVSVTGADWRSYQIRGNQRALVLTSGERTVVVHGSATRDELAALAASLS